MVMWKREDFLPSGSAESAPIFMGIPIAYAGKFINDRTLTIIKDGVCYNFAGKSGLINAKKSWLGIRNSLAVRKEFEKWILKWEKYDRELFQLAHGKSLDWKKGWAKLDFFQKKLWIKGYKIETLDNFADEIDALIVSELEKQAIPLKHKFFLVSPSEPNYFQRMLADRGRVRKKQIAWTEYAKKYWFSHGHWNGGQVLDEKTLEKDLREKIKVPDFNHIKEVHKKHDNLLDANIRTLIEIIRILSLWREERKAVVQKIMLGYANISNIAAKQLEIPQGLVRFAVLKEVKNLKNKPEILRERFKASAYLAEKGEWALRILQGKEAMPYMKEFLSHDPGGVLKGIVASNGKAQGKARIVLKEEDFSKFKKGEILITTMTRPEFFSIMRKAAAIVTDEGGLTCHAAIASRELGIPCVIGAKSATSVFKTGDIVEVDADAGFVKIFKSI